MAKKNKRNVKKKSQPKLNNVQLISIGVIIVVVIAAIWYIVSNQKPTQTSALPTLSPQASSITQIPSGPTSAPVAAPTVKTLQWSQPPAMSIDTTKQYFATVTMAKGGQFVIQLYPDKAPIAVNSFVFLANQGFFNGVTFHRVIDGFMAQGGDPTGTGMGGPGYQFANEINDLKFDKPGVVAMANAGPGTNGSQFFITFVPVQLSENDYTIFGQVISGMDVVNGITRRDPQTNPTFPGDAMASVTISTK
jgi:cyclophilin family peptidyl-prolyl cis-trans isomerase